MLTDQSNHVLAQAAHKKLTGMRTADLKIVFARWVDNLISPDEATRQAAYQMLKSGGERAIDVMIDSLSNREAQYQWKLVPILAEIGSEKALRAIATCLYAQNSAIVAVAAQMLGRSDSSLAADLLMARIARPMDVACATWIIVAMGQLKDQRSIPYLLKILHETESSTVRYTTVEALGKIGDRRVMPDICRYLNDDSHHVRDKAQVAIAVLTPKR